MKFFNIACICFAFICLSACNKEAQKQDTTSPTCNITDNETYNIDTFTVVLPNNDVYYLVSQGYPNETNEISRTLVAYKNINGSMQRVRVIDGQAYNPDKDPIKESEFSFSYYRYNPNLIYYGYGTRYLFDDKTQTLYIPYTPDSEITDLYRTYKFDGKKFQDQGLKPNPNLYANLGDYTALQLHFETKDYIIRIDELADNQLRFASWKRPKTISQKPDLILLNGTIHLGEDDFGQDTYYSFQQGNTQYLVNYPEKSEGVDIFYLIIKQKDKILLKQARHRD